MFNSSQISSFSSSNSKWGLRQQQQQQQQQQQRQQQQQQQQQRQQQMFNPRLAASVPAAPSLPHLAEEKRKQWRGKARQKSRLV